MQVTKFIHSTVLVENDSKAVLFDPGAFCWQDERFELSAIKRLDEIVVTHRHADHLSEEFLRALLEKFPAAQIICNDDVKKTIQEMGIEGIFNSKSLTTEPFKSPHEDVDPLLGKGATPDCSGYHFFGEFTHPGDSHSFISSKRILAMPFIGPWGHMMKAITVVRELSPELVFSIHDWHYSEAAQQWMHEQLQRVFADGPTKYVVMQFSQSQDL